MNCCLFYNPLVDHNMWFKKITRLGDTNTFLKFIYSLILKFSRYFYQYLMSMRFSFWCHGGTDINKTWIFVFKESKT